MYRINHGIRKLGISSSLKLNLNLSTRTTTSLPTRIRGGLRQSYGLSSWNSGTTSKIFQRCLMSTQNQHKSASSNSNDPHQTLTTQLTRYSVGDNIHGYQVESVEDIPELCLTSYRLRHTKNGAEHLHIARDDSNNVFSVAFRTTPEDSSGVAHILEHLALCGSRKFPVRDPFMKMLNRSLATFMNAFTGPDYTMYPFSTQNSKDYYNLLSIYLDAVFYPRLRHLDFLQEGWRLENADLNDPNSPLIFKGVVFNEMKGVFSSPQSIYSRALINKLFPDNTYRNESGGDPLDIPQLSYEALKEFHSKHYHPSNARFFTYGNFPLEAHLEAIDDVIGDIEENSQLPRLSYVNEQPRWSETKVDHLVCQNDPLAPFPDKQTTVGVAYMLETLTNVEENFTLALICSLLIDGPSSPFYEALIDSGLGSDYSPYSGFSNYTKQSMFSVGLQGIAQDQVDSVMKAVEMAFKNAYSEGFPQERIDALLHRIELGTKHQGTNFGLSLVMSVNSAWNHGVDPAECLKVNHHVEQFRAKLAKDSKYLQKKIKQYFLDNPHRLVVQMSPDSNYEQSVSGSEQKLLQEKVQQLSPEDRKKIYENGKKLLEAQDQVEDLTILPTLNVADIPRTIGKTKLETTKIGPVPVQYSAQATNGIVYFNSVLPIKLETFPARLLPYLPLFVQVMTKLGAGKMDRKQLDQTIQMHTGGLGSSVHIVDNPEGFDRHENGLMISSHCLERNIDQMFELWRDVFNGIRFDDDYDHLTQLIRIASAEMAASVSQNGHRYAMNRAAAAFGGTFKLRELTSGLSSLGYFRIMAASSNEPGKVKEIVANLKEISAIVLNSGNQMRVMVNAEQKIIGKSLKSLQRFIEKIPKKSSATESSTIDVQRTPVKPDPMNQHFVFPFSTNFLGRAVYCVPFVDADFAKLRIASSLLASKFLHKEIREKGGAYGGGAKLDTGGVVHFYSYRDPHIEETIEAFDRSGRWLTQGTDYRGEDIDEAKLQVFQSVDYPISAANQGLEYFLTGISDEMRQEYRSRLLDVNKLDIQEVADKYLCQSEHSLQSGIVLLGPNSEQTSTKPDKWTVRKASE